MERISLDMAGRMLLIFVYGLLSLKVMLQIAGILLDGGEPGELIINLSIYGERLAFLLLMLVFTAIRLPSKSSSTWTNRVVAILGSFLTLALPVFPDSPTAIGFRVLGVLISAVGLGFSIYVLSWLGRSFSVDAQARKLVTEGPYAIVRHPLYVCEASLFIGILLTNLSIFTVLLVAANLALQYWRIRNEERVLAAAFPEYVAYAARTPMLIPALKRGPVGAA